MKPGGTLANRIKLGFMVLILAISINTLPGLSRETPAAARGLSTSFAPSPTSPTSPKPAQGTLKISQTLYLPQIFNPDRIWRDSAIWAYSSSPAAHEVVLFRSAFTLDQHLEAAELHLFADTRYEVWLDGAWVGRGPARFSRGLHEYDVHQLGNLSTGEHLIAVLVQWAPNMRRSESTQPHLIGHLQGVKDGLPLIAASTGPEWRCWLSAAWRQDAVQVHSWQLIGPTELLDLRLLPSEWNQPGFDDSTWLNAQIIALSASAATADQPSQSAAHTNLVYQPRSIELLQNFPITPVLIDSGQLSPGFTIGEIAPTSAQTTSLVFSNSVSTTFTIETLDEDRSSAQLLSSAASRLFTGTLTSTIRLDGELMPWQTAASQRLDVISASVTLDPGDHSLVFERIPAAGITFAVSTQDLQYEHVPFEQGIHAGRRLLLAEPRRDLQLIKTQYNPDLAIEMDGLPAYAVLDLGRTVHGRLQAQVSGPAGSIIDIGWDERLYGESARPLPYPGSLHPEWNQVDSWILDGSRRSISTMDARAGRYILIAVWGSAPVTIDEIQVFEERTPIPSTGSFHSSNPLLDQIWQVGLDTLYPNMTDAYTDTPWRERGQWWGDAHVADHINRVRGGDLRLLKRGLNLMAVAFDNTHAPGLAPNSNDTHMLDFAMLWAASLSEYFRLTSDRLFLISVYPVLNRLIAHLAGFENAATHLLDLPEGNWSQVALVEWLGYSSRSGQSAAVNAMYYHTLLQAAYLAEQVGEPFVALQWRQKAQSVKDHLNALLYLPEVQRYATTIADGELISPTIHAQAWPLAYGLVPGNEIDGVASSMLEMLSPDPTHPNLDIYGMYWLLEALGQNGRVEEALGVIENYYGYLLGAGATTWWEGFNADQHPTASFSHAWGGSPTWFLSTYALGALWTGPDVWQVAPPFRGLTFASGSIPVSQGTLEVSWQRQVCQHASLELHAGEFTHGEVIIPLTDPLVNVTHNGELLWDSGKQNGSPIFVTPRGIHITLPGGDHILTIEYDC